MITESGLFGLAVYLGENGRTLERYCYGEPTDTDAFDQFRNSADRAIRSAESITGSRASSEERITRAWFYSDPGSGWQGITIPYASLNDERRTSPQRRLNPVTAIVARTLNANARGYGQQAITPEQRALQNGIANAYEQLPLYDLDNPLVRVVSDIKQ